MKTISDIFRLLYVVFIAGIGSYGAYTLFGEFVEMEKFPSINQILSILRKRWYAFLALAIALILFLLHLFSGLSG